MTTPTDKGTGAFLCENRHAMVHYWASECPACWNHARGRREALEEAADLVRGGKLGDAFAEAISALARKESRKEK
jgi:hypothetical protein